VSPDDAAAALAGVWLLVEYGDRGAIDEPWFESRATPSTSVTT
jgi:hypothetical protein